MATSAYYAWVRNGRPFTLIRPCDALRDTLVRHGYTVYGIGNDDHLMASTPEDHTPFSATGWPGKAKTGFGYALDIMPPSAGAKSKVDGKPLPSLQQLGAQIVKDRNAGYAPIGWLKYMNWEPQRDNGGSCWHDSWQPNFARNSSSDRGHIHISSRTGVEESSVGDGYDPVARIHGVTESIATTPKEPTVVRIKAKDAADRYLSNGAHIPSLAIDKLLEAKGVPLVEVDTTAQAFALLPPSVGPVAIDYAKLAKALIAELGKTSN